MLYGEPPFKGETKEEIYVNISKEKVKFPKKDNVSKDAKNLIKSLLTDSKKRLGSQCGASDIKDHPFFKDINWALLRSMKVPFKPKIIEYEIDYSDENSSFENEKNIYLSNDPLKRITANLICDDRIVSFPSANTTNDPFHFTKET